MSKFPPLLILRHGETVWNAQHRIQGSLDSDLTDKGVGQANQQRTILSGLDLTGYAAHCSPQGRAFHTASIALRGLVGKIQTDLRLVEIGVGDWEGLKRSEMQADNYPEDAEQSALMFYNLAPNGEGFDNLRVRCQSFLNALETPSIIVTHGITSRMLRLILLDMDNSEIGDLPGGQGVVYQLEDGHQRKLQIGA